ncbi:MAG: glycoside hydrolase family protein [Planctomycetota bacterium]|jgi:hypothetical protein
MGLSRLIQPDDLPGAPAFADPYVFKENGKWFITSTYSAKSPMYMVSTLDFRNIERHTLNLDVNESYLRKHVNNPDLIARHIWGFVPYKHDDGRWHAYATVHIGGYKTFVCHFSPKDSAAWPITEWVLDKVMVGGSSQNAYESKVYSDNTGLYLIYVETLDDGDNHIMAQKLLGPETVDVSFTARPLLSPEGLRSEDRNSPGGMQIVEGPNIKHVETPDGSKYVMFYAVGDFAQKNYKLAVAYSDVLIPSAGNQYQKPKAHDHSNIWRNKIPTDEIVYVLQTQYPDWFNDAGGLLKGPGLGNLVEHKDRCYVIFHALDGGQSRGRWPWIAPVAIDFTKKIDAWVTLRLP